MSAPALREPPIQPVLHRDAAVPGGVHGQRIRLLPAAGLPGWVQGELSTRLTSSKVATRTGGSTATAGSGRRQRTWAAENLYARSITLSSERPGLIARMDLIESDGGKASRRPPSPRAQSMIGSVFGSLPSGQRSGRPRAPPPRRSAQARRAPSSNVPHEYDAARRARLARHGGPRRQRSGHGPHRRAAALSQNAAQYALIDRHGACQESGRRRQFQ